MDLDKAIEAVLFYKAEPLEKTALAKLLAVEKDVLQAALEALGERLQSGATRLVATDTEVSLAVAAEWDGLIEGLRKDEMKRDIGKAGAETLAVVLYRAPVTRADIDRIRGVNSSYILRNLEVRGLVERRTGKRANEFVPTTLLLRHLGIREKTEMPDYVKVMNALEAFEVSQKDSHE
jgi:segregation and condensation protein B